MIYLSDAEIADLCAPLIQPAPQARYLRTLGLIVALKPNGRPVVIRGQAAAVLAGRALVGVLNENIKPGFGSQRQPNPTALINVLRRGHTHGTAKNAQPAESAPARLR